MTFTIPNLSAASHEDQAFPNSTDMAILSGGFTGDGIVSGCAVTAQGSPNMTVHVAAGAAYFNGVEVAVAAADPAITPSSSSPRRDLVVVNDAGSAVVVAGTPEAPDLSDPSVVPVLPALPASSIALAAVDVPANASVITSAEIVDKRIGSVGSFAAGLASAPSQGRLKDATYNYYGIPGASSLAGAINTFNFTQNTIRYFPFAVARGLTVDQVAAHNYTGTGAKLRIGIYEADTDWQPTDLIEQVEVTFSATGIVTGTLSASTLPVGRYLMAVNANTASNPTLYAPGWSVPIVGYSTTSFSGQPVTVGSVSASYAALPDPGTDWTTPTSFTSYQYVYWPVLMRVSALT